MNGKSLQRLLLVLCVAMLAGCASVPMTAVEDDTRAKSFAVQPGKANIYVYRNESMGGVVAMTVSLNGRVVGRTAAKTYLLLEVDPGTYEIASLTENTSTHKLMAQAGRNHFVWQEVKMGMFSARSELKEVDEATGRAGVMECKRIQASF